MILCGRDAGLSGWNDAELILVTFCQKQHCATRSKQEPAQADVLIHTTAGDFVPNQEDRLANGPFLVTVVVLTVLGSTLLHGLTAYPLARRYGEYSAALEKTRAEHADAPELPVRISHSANGKEGTP